MRETVGKISTKQNLSSETLFHFTSSLDVLTAIFETGFQARYVYEKIPGTKLAYFVRCVCFCDIPLGAVKWHLNWYGNYGIGLNRPWAKKNNITPVTYIHTKTPFIKRSSSKATQESLKVNPITPYLKQIKGKQYFWDTKNNEEYWKWKKFYEEREWRFLPIENGLFIQKYQKENELEVLRQKLNKNNNNHPLLKFERKDIEYIIIKDKVELYSIIQQIRKIIKNKREQDKMISKVLPSIQIIRDF